MTDNELVSTLDFDSLLYSLSRGEALSKDEKEKLASYIQNQVSAPKEKRSLEDLYGAFTVISKSNDSSLSYLLELAFEVPDPLLVSLALETLIIKWGIHENYLERLIQYALGTSYDHDGDIRESAFKCMNEIVITGNNELLIGKIRNLLLHIVNDEKETMPYREIAFQLLETTKTKQLLA